jgi:hypothetical protein
VTPIIRPACPRDQNKEDSMRSIISIPAAILTLCLAVGSAQAEQCVGSGTTTTFGANGTGWFEVKSGQACQYAFSLMGGGAVSNSRITVRPKNGTARMLDATSFEYKAKRGYKGPDTFAIEATGSSIFGSGKSVVTMNVAVN